MSEGDLSDAIKIIRTFVTARILGTPVGTLQHETSADREARGPCWVSRVVLPAPVEKDALDIILDAVKGLGVGNERYTTPVIENVRAQWTGYRAGVQNDEPEPNISEMEKLRRLQGEYRLAPQNPFPAAVLDCLIAYLTLLYPLPCSPNASVPAGDVVFAGDSSGAGLALSLVQVILNARRRQGTEQPTLEFHGRKVVLPMPAGLAFQSPSLDTQLNTMPSWAANFEYDTVPLDPPGYDAGFPADEVWPSSPARGNYYCETSMLYHPLVCAMAAKNWHGCPPIYMAIGSKERIVDGAKYVAQQVARQGVPTLWDEYELMPHNWPMGFPNHALSEKCYHSWAKACSYFADGRNIQTHGTFTALDSQVRELEVTELTTMSTEEVGRLMRCKESSIRPFTGKPVAKCHL
ncbi:MAG: hypothetical protein Q9197_000852 [Variospora fuerteventurae]